MAIMKVELLSQVLKQQTQFNVILPEAKGARPEEVYASGRKYKVLWLLHGLNGTCDTWLHDSKVNIYVRNKPVIVVMPSAMNSFYSDYQGFGTGFNYPDYFFNDLMPFVHNWLPASSKREDNFLCGLSMGASGTFQFAMMHPEKFGGIAPLSISLRSGKRLSEYAHMTGYEFRKFALENPEKTVGHSYHKGQPMSMHEINGIAKYDTVRDYMDSWECTMERYEENALKLPPMFYGCGMLDENYEEALKIRDTAERLGVKNAVFDYVPGYGHDSYFWDHELPKVLEHFHITD